MNIPVPGSRTSAVWQAAQNLTARHLPRDSLRPWANPLAPTWRFLWFGKKNQGLAGLVLFWDCRW